MSDPLRPLRSSVGSKSLVALTGLGLVGFVLAHMSGNLLVFAGQDAMNTYAAKLKAFGALLWVARAGLVVLFTLHIVLALRLTYGNRAARPVGYVYEDTLQASWASRYMWLTGLVLLGFLLFHLAHFTFGAVHKADLQSRDAYKNDPPPRSTDPVPVDKNYLKLADVKNEHGEYRPQTDRDYDWHFLPKKEKEDVRHDVYSMVISGYRTPWISITYLVSMIFLALHLWHGASSMFQSIGLSYPTWRGRLAWIGPAIALVVLVGNCSIVLAVWSGLVK